MRAAWCAAWCGAWCAAWCAAWCGASGAAWCGAAGAASLSSALRAARQPTSEAPLEPMHFAQAVRANRTAHLDVWHRGPAKNQMQMHRRLMKCVPQAGLPYGDFRMYLRPSSVTCVRAAARRVRAKRTCEAVIHSYSAGIIRQDVRRLAFIAGSCMVVTGSAKCCQGRYALAADASRGAALRVAARLRLAAEGGGAVLRLARLQVDLQTRQRSLSNARKPAPRQ